MNAPLTIQGLDRLKAGFLAKSHELFIDGDWVKSSSGETIEVLDPATGAPLAKVSAGNAADIDKAVKAARRAFESGPWASMGAAQRGRLINRLADAIEANADELALLESLDGGNPLGSVRNVDVNLSVASLRYHAGWTDKLMGETPLTAQNVRGFSYAAREPIGVAGLITPWNAPFFMAVNKVAPCLAAGCTAVLKPAELAPLTALKLAELAAEVGFPAGVLNVVTGHGDPAGKALVDHPDVDKISFTGSTRVGKTILAGAALNLKRVTLELGGKSPIVVFNDADLDRAANSVASEIFFKTGQFCAAGTRLYVQKKAFDRVVDTIAERAKTLKVGPGVAADTEMGPIISQKQLDRVMDYITQGLADGAECVTGGRRIQSEGYFVQPTVLTKTHGQMSVVRDEVFGPVLCAMPFDDAHDLEEVARQANDTTYGLAAKLWTRDVGVAHQLARRIKAGTITVNDGHSDSNLPFGGFKQSGLGREGGRDGVLAYTELKSVAIGF